MTNYEEFYKAVKTIARFLELGYVQDGSTGERLDSIEVTETEYIYSTVSGAPIFMATEVDALNFQKKELETNMDRVSSRIHELYGALDLLKGKLEKLNRELEAASRNKQE